MKFCLTYMALIISLAIAEIPLSGQENRAFGSDLQRSEPVSGVSLSHNALYIELAGPGLLYSLNYEYRFSQKFSVRAGLSMWSIDSLDLLILQIKNFKYRSFPLMINYMTGKRSSHFELGLGIMPLFVQGDFTVFYFLDAGETSKTNHLLGIGTIGYRYQRNEGGFIFRAGATPVFSSSGGAFTFGISLGYGF
jgi:hypothetical protein